MKTSVKPPAASVVIPFQNGGKILRAALDALLGFTYWGFRSILEEEASTDFASYIRETGQ
jgi:hypothetical protein